MGQLEKRTIAGKYIIEKICRLCGSINIEPILFLGDQPLANSLLSHIDQKFDAYPLTLCRCLHCGCVQLRETVSPEVLFSHYLYFSSYADALVSNARDLCTSIISKYYIGSNDLVVEIGSNDGYLLGFYQNYGVKVLGVEPAANIAKIANEEKCVPTLVDFFSLDTARRIKQKYGPAKVIHANNVLAHIHSLHDVMEGIREILHPLGFCVVEVSYVKDMMDNACFDMIYHEHLFYHCLDSLRRIFAMHGLDVFDVVHIPTHGGSLRVFAGYPGIHDCSIGLQDFMDEEAEIGILDKSYYQVFSDRVVDLKKKLLNTLWEIRKDGKTIVAYGAPAKATVLLNYFGIGKDVVDYIVDRNPHKQGHFIPGPNLPILHPDAVKRTNPDFLFILSWNLKEEIFLQMDHIREWGGRFIVPLPDLEII